MTREHEHEPLIDESGTGSTRSVMTERYDLISPVGLRRLARRYAVGAEKHGERNWERGQKAGVVINHMLKHLNDFSAGDRSDDHLAAVAWGAFALMHFQEHCPEMFAGFPGPEGDIAQCEGVKVAGETPAVRPSSRMSRERRD
jgi:hypothetical protein